VCDDARLGVMGEPITRARAIIIWKGESIHLSSPFPSSHQIHTAFPINPPFERLIKPHSFLSPPSEFNVLRSQFLDLHPTFTRPESTFATTL
jgi:hypothetical protein